MALNNQDADTVGYKAKITWYKERIAALTQGFVNPSAANTAPDADKYLKDIADLRKKIDKLNKRIDEQSAGLKIPIDKNKDPDIYEAVLQIDPDSGGAYLSYELYKRAMDQVSAGLRNVKLEDIALNSSYDTASSSQQVQSSIYEGYAKYEGKTGQYSYTDMIRTWGDVDHILRQVINYGDDFLCNFHDSSYDPWAFKRDIAAEVMQSDNMTSLWNNFSNKGKAEMDNLGGSLKNIAALRPDPRVADVTDRYLDYTNNFLNDVNDLFNNGWTADLICCFLKFGTQLDTKTLQGLKTMLELLKLNLNLDFNALLNAFKDIFNNIMRELILNQLMGLVHQMLQRIVAPIKRWLEQAENKWNKLFECLPIKLLIMKYIQEVIASVEAHVYDLLNEWYKELELKKIYRSAKISQAIDNKWINRAISLLSIIMKAMELAAQCSVNNTPNSDPANQVMDQISGDTIYAYPVESSPNIYNSFITPGQQVAIESALAAGNMTAVAGIINQTETQKNIEVSQRLADCRKSVSPADLPDPISWLL
jgi:hypothetical protein